MQDGNRFIVDRLQDVDGELRLEFAHGENPGGLVVRLVAERGVQIEFDDMDPLRRGGVIIKRGLNVNPRVGKIQVLGAQNHRLQFALL